MVLEAEMLFSTFFAFWSLQNWREETNIIVICCQSEAGNFETAQRVDKQIASLYLR